MTVVNSIHIERAVIFHLCCFVVVTGLDVCVPIPFGVLGRMWTSIVPVPHH